MLYFITLLLLLQLIGEVVVVATGLPLPGPVIGMVLLFIGLMIHGSAGHDLPESADTTSSGFLDNLSLLFVPAGVGVVLHLSLVQDEWLAITAALLGSTIITIGVTALVMVWLLKTDTGETKTDENSGKDTPS